MDLAERRRRRSQRQVVVVMASNLQHEDLDKVISVCCSQVSCCSMHCTVRRLVIEQAFCNSAHVSCSLSEGEASTQAAYTAPLLSAPILAIIDGCLAAAHVSCHAS